VNCNSVAGNIPSVANSTPSRTRGQGITITAAYNPTNLLFLPSTFFGVPIRTTLPSYAATAMLE
jgi:hypothetical protein